MRKRILTLISAFILSINFICSMSLNVYASDDLRGFDSWSLTEKMNYWAYNASQIYFGAVGFAHGNAVALDLFLESEYDKLLLEDCSYEEWICARMGVQQNTTTGEYELVLDDELVDLMKQACDKYINEECGWYEWYTHTPADLINRFTSKCQYDYLVSLVNDLDIDEVIVCRPYNTVNSVDTSIYVKYKYDGMLHSNTTDTNLHCVVLCYEWEQCKDFEYFSMTSAGVENWKTSAPSNYHYQATMLADKYPSYPQFVVTKSRRLCRVYKTVEEYKAYSVGERPYYATSDFYNYDSSQDNSVTLTGSDLSNGSVYGDVYNYIINNYDNPDGLTEDELRDILDDYFNNSGGGSGSSGNDSGSGSSGNGLMDFLGGLGSIGDAILSILGKLLEYIGKALDLISGTVTKVIDIIPKNITALLGALFPFFPEEWLTAIELGLVLAVIVGIVGLFKK